MPYTLSLSLSLFLSLSLPLFNFPLPIIPPSFSPSSSLSVSDSVSPSFPRRGRYLITPLSGSLLPGPAEAPPPPHQEGAELQSEAQIGAPLLGRRGEQRGDTRGVREEARQHWGYRST